jgi:hypothetical protein
MTDDYDIGEPWTSSALAVVHDLPTLRLAAVRWRTDAAGGSS